MNLAHERSIVLHFFIAGLVSLFIFADPAFAGSITEQAALQTEAEAENLSKNWDEKSVLQSLSLYQKAAGGWEELGSFEKSAACLREAGKLKLMLNKPGDAYELFVKALYLERKNKNVEGESETLSYLTIVAIKTEKTVQAARYYQRALLLARRNGRPKTSALAYFAAAEWEYKKRNLPLMIEYQEKALYLFRQAEDKSGEAEVLTYLSYSYVMNNDRLKGKEQAQRAVEIQRELGNKRGLAFALISLGDAHKRMGEWQAAVTLFREAERIFPDKLDSYEKAILYDRFGVFYETYGDLIEAQKYYEKALNLFLELGNVFGSSELLTVLGQVSKQLGQQSLAISYFNQAREIAEKSKDPVSLGMADENLGDVYFDQKLNKKALNYYKNALKNFEKVGMQHLIASVTEKLGKQAEYQGNAVQARRLYQSALEMNKRIHSRVAQAQTLFSLAKLDNAQNQTAAALTNIEESLKLTEYLHNDIANSKLKRDYLSEAFARYELYVDLLMKMHQKSSNENYAIRGLQAAEQARSRSMIEILSLTQANFTKDAPPEIVQREKELHNLLNLKADKLTDALSSKAPQAAIRKLDGEINELELQLEEIKAVLKQSSPIYSTFRNSSPFDLDEFQKRVLDDNSLLLEFHFGEERSYLWLVDKLEVVSFVLPPREQINRGLENLRELLVAREIKKEESIDDYQKRIREAENRYSLEAQNLSNVIFGQIADKIINKRLIVVPDGNMHYFPVSALPLPNAKSGEPILLTNETIYESSAQMLSLITKTGDQVAQAKKNLLVFSDPVFSADDSRLSAKSNEIENSSIESYLAGKFRFAESLDMLPRLVASKEESDSVISIVGAEGADVFSGFSANREQLFNAKVSDYKIIHLAAHGLIDKDRPELSGIILSRYDEKGRKIDEFLRLRDIYALNFSADLVVLSACSTSVGKQVKGEGLMSLNNAFLQSGAKSVVSSFWKVDDYATVELMKNFYAALAGGTNTPSQALRQAQLKMMQNPRYKSPFYWAAFNLQGNYRQTPSLLLTRRNYSVYLWFLLLPILSLGFYRWYKSSKTK